MELTAVRKYCITGNYLPGPIRYLLSAFRTLSIFRTICNIKKEFVGLTLLVMMQWSLAFGQVIINEIGIAPATGNGSGGEFVELFNKGACTIDLSCYTLVFSSTTGTGNPSGWTLKIPSGYSIPSCGYFLIGGVSGLAGIVGSGYPTGGTPIPYSGTADLNIGSNTDITANAVFILQSVRAGTFPDAGGQLTLINSSGIVVSSVAYGSGNNPGSYPLSAYTTCNASGNTQGANNIIDPGNSANFVAGPFSGAGNQGIYLNSSGVYQVTTVLTPGGANSSQLTCASPISFTNVSSNSPLCTGNTLSLTAMATGGTGLLTYSWTGPDGFSSSSQNPSISNITASANGVYTVKATDADGCNASNAATVTINPVPLPTIIYHNKP